MATYKKRGFKNKALSSKADALEKKSTTANVFNTLDDGSSSAQLFFKKNQKIVFISVGLIVTIILGYIYYNTNFVIPNEKNAFDKMYFAQKKFDEAILINSDSLYDVALNGDDINMGMLDIIEEYDGTNASNLAYYYSGMMYLKMNDYQNSIKYLSEFSSEDILLAPLAIGSIGDSFAELNQYDDALDYYVEASKIENNYTSPIYLFKAGTVAMKLNEFKLAEDYFRIIKLDYPKSPEAQNIDAFISKAIASNQ